MSFTKSFTLQYRRGPKDNPLSSLSENLFKPTQKEIEQRDKRLQQRIVSGFRRMLSTQQRESNLLYQASIHKLPEIRALYEKFEQLALPLIQGSGMGKFMAFTKLFNVKLHSAGRKSEASEDDIAVWEAVIDASQLSQHQKEELENTAQILKNREKMIMPSDEQKAIEHKALNPLDVINSIIYSGKVEKSEWLLAPAEEEEELPEIETKPPPPPSQPAKVEEEPKEEKKAPEILDVHTMPPQKVNWFKHIIDTHVEEESMLYNAETLGFVLDRLMSKKSDEELQGQLADIFGFDNFDLLLQLFEKRDYIRSLASDLRENIEAKNRRKQNQLHAQVGVTVTMAKAKRSGKKRKEAQNQKRTESSNLELLMALGFSEGFVRENHKLGLKEHPTMQSIPQYVEKESEDLIQSYQMFGAQSSIIPVKKQLGVEIVDDNFNYKHYKIPAVPKKKFAEDNLINIAQGFPEWAQPAFRAGKVQRLNPIQSQVYNTAFKSNKNMLVCAPTGAGKTNIALMTILREISYFAPESKNLSQHIFTLIYIAPMKALVNEIVHKFSTALGYLKLRIRECTGDMQLSRAEIAETHLIVTTPEKWDVITRKPENTMSQVRLMILDEIHLLNQDRGSVLECLVARAMRTSEHTQLPIRLVGLSATLPNYYDVANFMMADPSSTFFFDESYRPTPLQYEFYGLKNMNNQQRERQLLTDITFNIARRAVFADKQVLVFVHTRNETIKTSEELIEKMQREGSDTLFCGDNSWRFEREVNNSRNEKVKNFFTFGIGIHNAGMLRKDRNLSETLFESGAIRVLVTTSTLAWGVNLPAHTVVIKGTQFYDPTSSSVGGWKDIGIFDVQQIFGRAGRPQYDTEGTGIILTSMKKMDDYVRSLARQNSVESNMHNKIEDALNAEIAIGTVTSLPEAVQWLKFTYLSHRIQENYIHYGFTSNDASLGLDNLLFTIVEKTATRLHNLQMIRYNANRGFLSPTALGRIASNYYLSVDSMAEFESTLKPSFDKAQVLLAFAKGAKEFKQIQSRKEEQSQLMSLYANCPRNLVELNKTEIAESYAKTLILYAHYLMGTSLRAFSLVADTNYIIQNSVRVLKGLFEIALFKNRATLAQTIHTLALQLQKRLLPHYSELMQFTRWSSAQLLTTKASVKGKGARMDGLLHDHIVNHLHQQGVSRLIDLIEMPEEELRSLLPVKQERDQVVRLVNHLPKLILHVSVRPITHSILEVKLQVEPDFQWSDRWNGKFEDFRLIVDNQDELLHTDVLSVTRKDVEFLMKLRQKANKGKEVYLEEKLPTFKFFLPYQAKKDEWQHYYLLRLVSEKWVGIEYIEEIDLTELNIQEDKPLQTTLLKLHPLPISALQNEAYQGLYKGRFDYFNPIQTQVFHTLYHSNINCLIGAPTGSGKTIMSEFAILRLFNKEPDHKVIYIAPLKALAKERIEDWSQRLGKQLGKKVVELTGDYTPDIIALQQASVVITTPEKWDGISRNWHHRSYVQQVGLIVIDEIHLLGQDRGPVLEVIVSRMRYISNQLDRNIRVIGLSTALANANDVANWLGIEGVGVYNFKPSVRPVPVKVFIDGFSERAYCPRMATMNKPAFHAIQNHSPSNPVLIFVSSRRQTRLTALDLIAYCANEGHGSERQFLNLELQEIEAIADQVQDQNLKHTLIFGIGMHHAGLVDSDRKIVEHLFVERKIQVLVTTSTLAWGVNFPARLVIIKGTQFYDVKLHKYVDMPITDILQMMGRAGRPQFDDQGIAVLFVQETKKNFYKKFLYEPFPVQSSLPAVLVDHLNAEIAGGTLSSKQSCMDYLTWTYFIHRLLKNPTYYGVQIPKPDPNEPDSPHRDIEIMQRFLHTLIDNCLKKLKESGCIELEYAADSQQISIESTYKSGGAAAHGELVSTHLISKKKNKFIKAEEDFIPPESTVYATFLGRLASYYYLVYQTVAYFDKVLSKEGQNEQSTGSLRMVDMVYSISHAKEFGAIPTRHNEDTLNEALAQLCPLKYGDIQIVTGSKKPDYESPNMKTFLLLQAHFARLPLPIADYITDTKSVLDQTMRVLQAMIDICAHKGLLRLALDFINMSQMVIQGCWIDSPAIMNIPGIGRKGAERLASQFGITQLAEIMSIQDRGAARHMIQQDLGIKKNSREYSLSQILQHIGIKEESRKQAMKEIERIPRLRVRIHTTVLDEFTLKPDPSAEIKQGSEIMVGVELNKTRIGQTKVHDNRVRIGRFPKIKDASWYVLVGLQSHDQLCSLKRIIVREKCRRNLQVQLPSSIPLSKLKLNLYVLSDSYIGIDQVHQIYLQKNSGWGPLMGDEEEEAKSEKYKLNDDWVYESDNEVKKLLEKEDEESESEEESEEDEIIENTANNWL